MLSATQEDFGVSYDDLDFAIAIFWNNYSN